MLMLGRSRYNQRLHVVNELRADVDKLFSPTYAKVTKSKFRKGVLLGTSVDDSIELNNVPEDAISILLEGNGSGIEVTSFAALRHQAGRSTHLFGRAAMTEDLLICSLDGEYLDSFRKIFNPIFYYEADMTQPSIPYNERFANFVTFCLENMPKLT